MLLISFKFANCVLSRLRGVRSASPPHCLEPLRHLGITREDPLVLHRRRLHVDLVMPRRLDLELLLEVVQLLVDLAQLSAEELVQRPGLLQHPRQLMVVIQNSIIDSPDSASAQLLASLEQSAAPGQD
jgi:hypothetical protein